MCTYPEYTICVSEVGGISIADRLAWVYLGSYYGIFPCNDVHIEEQFEF